MGYCSVSNCGNCSGNSDCASRRITFHRFPKDPDIKNKWILATGKRNWFPTSYSVLCSIHFREEDFNPTRKRRTLLQDACPTIDVWTTTEKGGKRADEPPDDKRSSSPMDLNNTRGVECALPAFQTSPSTSSSFLPSKSQKRPVELDPDILETPRKKKMRRIIQTKESIIKSQRLKIRRLQCKNRRYRKKIQELQEVLKDLEEKRFINAEQAFHLENTNVSVKDLISRCLKKLKSGKLIRSKYSAGLRSFAMTLHFYSPKAYQYVRQKFETCLPNMRTIKKWYQSINAEPGFTTESLNAIKIKVKSTQYSILCNLCMDEMAIRKRVEWDGNRMHGYVDFGNAINGDGDHLSEAKEALVFLLTAINGAWKIPVGYFFTDGITGEQKANLVKQCLELLQTTGVEVVSFTFDGCPANITMAKLLGCSFELNQMKTSFEHPISQKPVCIMLDACHMIKLVRNAFEANKTLKDDIGRDIEWSLLEKLNELQEKEHLHLANKLRRRHVSFHNQKMKVKLATQLMSNSVAKALSFCYETNQTGFSDVQGTIDFIKNLNDLFDILNSRHINQLHMKKPINIRNKEKIFTFLERVELYLKSLKMSNGTAIIKSTRKTGFLGLLTCINSIKNMYVRLVEDEQKLKYLPTYKLSQDHLELMFGNIRAHGGCNTNPTARQFKAIYKKIIVKLELRDFESGNCMALENISILSSSSSVEKINKSTLMPFGEKEESENETDMEESKAGIIEEILQFDVIMSEFSSEVVGYIAGNVVHVLLKKIKCETCISALLNTHAGPEEFKLIRLKDNGGLILPSSDVVHICKKIENILKNTIIDAQVINDFEKFKNQITNKALYHFVGIKIFKEIDFHQFDQTPMENHVILLVKCVIEKYLDIRLHYLMKNAAPKLSKRQLLTKYLHFTGQ